ncbi:unnamed protein product [Nippostrongylus brasiliensis]|uniref:Integrase catalytic domain-containing protein n=1 Tax=Nippostrongylus brasiliensis TaxID=27835 RepID=A0A0N4Y4S9_NIPBR|nr:unnamed protein product [Nippostrongylus brasiliensis]
MAEVRTHYWIPQLRRQVQEVIRRCIPCQRVNNLPYRYPELPDLPSRRVVRSGPFQHVGIDYFGPITVKSNEESDKAYGVIITCTTTRLIHLECVTDMSTVQLLDALRRFFARRGVPETITSDNAPYFILGDQILRDAASASVANTTVAATMATNGIAWKMITPYAPWQGAFYERLIKIIKHSVIKTIEKKVLSLGGLTTLLIEIEGILNTRPLTYQEDCREDRPTLRPVDFIQRDMNITYPMDGLDPSADDADCYPPEESFQLRTRAQAKEALHSSCQFTERFWKIWSEKYLTALREQHTRRLALKNDTPKVPTPGTVVLLVDPNLLRNTWKIGRITKLNPSKDSAIREVELILPNRRKTRRPINLLVPLELDGRAEEHIGFQQQAEESIDARKPTTHRYNLRRRNSTNNNLLLSSTFITVIYAMALVGIATSVSNPTCPHESYDEILDFNISPPRNPPSYSPRDLMETAHVSTILPIISNLYSDCLIPISLPSQLIRNDLYSSYPARVLHIRQSIEKAPTTQMQNCAAQKLLSGNQELKRTSFTSKSLSECLCSKLTSERPEQKKSNGTLNNTNNSSTNKKMQPRFIMDSRSSELLPREYSDRALSTTNSNDDMGNLKITECCRIMSECYHICYQFSLW